MSEVHDDSKIVRLNTFSVSVIFADDGFTVNTYRGGHLRCWFTFAVLCVITSYKVFCNRTGIRKIVLFKVKAFSVNKNCK